MSSRGRARVVFVVVALVAALVAACRNSAPTSPSPSASPTSIAITVNGAAQTVPARVSLGAALKSLDLKPQDGRLLDVQGGVIEKGAFPAKLFVNGKRAKNQTTLADGDVVEFTDGRDRTEETTTQEKYISEPRPANPQNLLGTAAGVQITTVGKVSGKVESIIFRPQHLKEPKAVALTFDDGPHPTYTPKVLRILRRYHAPSTFFVLGYLAKRYPALIKEMVAQGHVVASHSWNHPHDFRSLPVSKQTRQIEDSVSAIRDAGADPYLFRPPEGSYDDSVVEIARRAGLRVVMWSVSAQDYDEDRTARDLERIILGSLRPGAIILLHDGGGDQSAMVKALPAIIKGIRQRGYSLTTIPR